MNNNNAIYSVYMHISPDGKRYIGQCKDINRRWQKGGLGYNNNDYFWNDIQKYGWDNFEHLVIHSQLSKQEALHLESELIHQYQTIDPNKGYNNLTGGKYKGEISNIYRKKLQSAQLDFRSFSNSCWVSKENEAILISKDMLDSYLKIGYHEGRFGENAIYINKDGITKRIKDIELAKYVAEGWLLGKSDH